MGRLLLAAQLLLLFQLSSQQNVSISPSELVANEGENATFVCAPLITAARPVLHTLDPGADNDNVEIVEVQTDDKVNFIDNGDNRTYIWIRVNRTDDHLRQFQCEINDMLTPFITLRVNFAPEYEAIDPVNAVEGDRDLVVTIPFGSRPDPDYQWTRDGEPIQNSPTRTLTASSVTLSTVSREDRGTYVVMATNSAGSGSGSFSLLVTYPPRFIGGSGTVESSFREDENPMLDCSVDSNPEADVTFTTPQGSVNLALDNTYTITNIQSTDAGQYVCTANNTLGTVLLTYNVQVGGLPGTVSNIEVTVSENNIVTVSWTAADSNGVDITAYVVRVLLDGREVYSNEFETTSGEVSRSQVQQVTSDMNVEYTITVTARNGVGDGQPTSQTFTLPAGSSASIAAVPTAILSALLMLCLSLIF